MARKLNQLSALVVKKLHEPGNYLDGGGLRLQIAKGGSKSWLFRYQLGGKVREMGLGGYPTITLLDARQKALDARKLLVEGIDPLAARDASKESVKAAEVATKIAEAKRKTFKQCAEAYIADHEDGWKSDKLGKLWAATLRDYAHPVFGHLPVNEVDTALVMDVLRPIWKPKPETAARVRMRVENILDWAKVQGLRDGENPARWKGHLDHLLPERHKVAKVQHHAALPYAEVADFMAEVRGREALAARGLELLILTATRTSEVLGATWGEIDLDGAIWTIPAERMKMDREHRVPLSTQAVSMLRRIYKDRTSETWVFPGGRAGKSLSNMAFLVLLKRMERTGITPHGFRSSFRDWASETTAYPHEVCEMALAHTIKNKAEAAYRRGDLFEKRTKLMQDWANYCEVLKPTGPVS